MSIDKLESLPKGFATGQDLVLLGRFGAPHGVRGEIKLLSFTAVPEAIVQYQPLQGRTGRVFGVTLVRSQGEALIVRVAGIADRTAAEGLVNQEVYAPRAALGAPEEDEFLHADLIGLKAVGEDGTPFGKVIAVHDFGAGDILEVAPVEGGATRLLPFTKAIVPIVDVRQGHLVIIPPLEVDDA